MPPPKRIYWSTMCRSNLNGCNEQRSTVNMSYGLFLYSCIGRYCIHDKQTGYQHARHYSSSTPLETAQHTERGR